MPAGVFRHCKAGDTFPPPQLFALAAWLESSVPPSVKVPPLSTDSVPPSVRVPPLLTVVLILGSTQLKPGRFNVWGTVIALYLLATGVKGLQLAGGALWITDLFNGVALVGAVSLAVISARRRGAGAKKRAARRGAEEAPAADG